MMTRNSISLASRQYGTLNHIHGRPVMLDHVKVGGRKMGNEKMPGCGQRPGLRKTSGIRTALPKLSTTPPSPSRETDAAKNVEIPQALPR